MKINYIKEGYFKTPSEMKKEIEQHNQLSNVEKLNKNAGKVFLQKRLEDINLKTVEERVEYAIAGSDDLHRRKERANWHNPREIRVRIPVENYNPKFDPEFAVLSENINSQYFDLNLRNQDDIVSKGEYFIEVTLEYTGTIEVVHNYNKNDLIRDLGGDEILVRAAQDDIWPNPDIVDLKNDLELLRKYLEHKFPGVYFKIYLNVLAIEGDFKIGGYWEKKHYGLCGTESSWDEILNAAQERLEHISTWSRDEN